MKKKTKAAGKCDLVLQQDLNSILLNGGFANGQLDYEEIFFDNNSNRQDVLLDVGHHYDDYGNTIDKKKKTERQLVDNSVLPRMTILNQLSVAGLT